MKKIPYIISLLIIFACEDDKEESPFLGTWQMNEISGGLFMRVNKTQNIYLGSTEGKIEAKTYIDEKINNEFLLTQFNININEDGTFISARNTFDQNIQYSASYYIEDYYGSLDQYDNSRFSISSPDDYFNYTGTKFDYIANDISLQVSSDTVYRELYINNNIIIDSSRYAVINGEIKNVSSTITAYENYLMEDQMIFPEEITLTLNDDGTGKIKESFGNEINESDIEWIATDSTFQWNYCIEDVFYEELDCQYDGPIFKYTINDNSLTLFLYQDQCSLDPGFSCDEMMNLLYGIEIGTLDAFWSEATVKFSKTQNQAFKKMLTKNNMQNKRGEQFSLINGFKK